MPVWADGTLALLVSLLLVNLLVLLEVADRLSLKGELEVAREIQLAMLPTGTYRAGDIEICGMTRPANTVGGDFYDVLPLADGRIIVTLGDVAGKGSPAALLMALLLAVLRTLVDEELEPPALVERLNVQICRHSPSSRFITLVLCRLLAVDRRADLRQRRPESAADPAPRRHATSGCGSTGVALGMFEHSTFGAVDTLLAPGETLVLYSDGITEAEDPAGRPFEEVRPRVGRRTVRARGAGGDRRAGSEGGRSAREGVAVHRRPDDPAAEAAPSVPPDDVPLSKRKDARVTEHRQRRQLLDGLLTGRGEPLSELLVLPDVDDQNGSYPCARNVASAWSSRVGESRSHRSVGRFA